MQVSKRQHNTHFPTIFPTVSHWILPFHKLDSSLQTWHGNFWEHLLSCPTSPTDPSSHALAIKHTNLVHLQVRCHHIPHKAFHINKKQNKKVLQHCPAKNHTWRFSNKTHCFHGTDALWTSLTISPKISQDSHN